MSNFAEEIRTHDADVDGKNRSDPRILAFFPSSGTSSSVVRKRVRETLTVREEGSSVGSGPL